MERELRPRLYHRLMAVATDVRPRDVPHQPWVPVAVMPRAARHEPRTFSG